jgi:hypothetical protein
MSTTTDRKTASAYSGVTRNRGTVLEISAGQIDNGASISFLSQYPGEAEFLMPPLCSLEVLSLPSPTQTPILLLDVFKLCMLGRSWESCASTARLRER